MKRKVVKSKLRENYWQSYSDMMAGLLLIFIFLIAGTMIELKKEQTLLSQAEQNLLERDALLSDALSDLEEKEKDYAEMEEQLNQILGIKEEIVSSLQEAYENKGMSIEVDDETGAIKFDADVFFNDGKYNLLGEGKDTLDKVIPTYLSVLLSPEYVDYISEITIEGHCSSSGGYEYNLSLSQDRAKEVALYCQRIMSDQLPEADMKKLRRLMTISGRSNTNLIMVNGKEDDAASKRVEIKFSLKDDEAIAVLIQTLDSLKEKE